MRTAVYPGGAHPGSDRILPVRQGVPSETMGPPSVIPMLSRARDLALSSHPGPTAAVTVLSALLAASLGYPTARILVLAVAVLLGQLSIGFSNDWIDSGRDRATGRHDKPVAQGRISVPMVRRAAIVTLVAALAVSIALGPAAALCHLVLIASGWAYNAGLKRTPFSVVPFVIAFGILPDVVTLSGQEGVPAAGWATAVGALFGVAIHFTNVLPDLADDAETDVRGLPHRLGARVSGVVAFAVLVVASVLVLIGPVAGDNDRGVTLPAVFGLVISLAIAAIGIRRVLTIPPDRLLFQLVIVMSLVVAVSLVLSGGRLTA